jgi:hypothetical protein
VVAVATDLHDPTLIALSAPPLRGPALTWSLQVLSVGAGTRKQKGASMAQQDQGSNGEVFAWVELIPAEEGKLEPPTFRVFQIDVKSDTDIGHVLHNDPLRVLRDDLPPENDVKIDEETRVRVRELSSEVAIDEGARAQVLRVNAERPANPVKRKEVWIVYPDNTTAVGVQYKYLE